VIGARGINGHHARIGAGPDLTGSRANVVFAVSSVSGATPSASVLAMSVPSQSHTVTNSQWHPSGDQGSPLAYQVLIPVRYLCAGGGLNLAHGGTFSATRS
jgi:hypothetical protein